MPYLSNNIDAGTGLAGTGKLEILVFTLCRDNRTGREVTLGVNVSTVREVVRIPEITRLPEMPALVEGMVSLHGVPVPVIDLAKLLGIETDSKPESMIVTEYGGRMRAFLVRTVGSILFLDLSEVREPPVLVQEEMGGLVAAVTELSDGRLVMMLDLESVLEETGRFDTDRMDIENVLPSGKRPTRLHEDEAWRGHDQESPAFGATLVESSHADYDFGVGLDGMQDQADARTGKTGILLFSLGGKEKFGINVFKVKEVCPAGNITRTPNMPSGVEGIVLLHGHVVPVLNLANLAGAHPPEKHHTMMVAEFNKRMLGFLVKGVDRIVRVDIDKVSAAGELLSDHGPLTGSVAELEDGTLVSILDVKQIIARVFGDAVLEVLCE